tara:strand:- start:9071 stop:9448 length:378 start_codon:yes stop_codon:yes gene_type:complete
MTIQALRQDLADSLSGVVASVYSTVPESPIPPLAAILPDSPYLESNLIGSTIQVKVNFIISAAVANLNNAAALDNLEQLIISILAAMPSGYVVGDVNRPTVASLANGSTLLIADISVSTYYTEEN